MTLEVSVKIIEEGKRALELRDLANATGNFSKAILEEDYREPEYWCLLAESLFYQARFEDALVCWKEAAKMDPFNRLVWVRISALYALMDENELAKHYYQISEKFPLE